MPRAAAPPGRSASPGRNAPPGFVATTSRPRRVRGAAPPESGPVVVLIAETDRIVRSATAETLSHAGFETIEVGTAAEALVVLECPALVGMMIAGRRIVGDGVALAHLVHHRWPGVGIVVTSGAGAGLQRALPPGTCLLDKPYTFAGLVYAVEAGLLPVRDEPASAPVVPGGVPPHRGADLGHGAGAVAAPSTEADKT